MPELVIVAGLGASGKKTMARSEYPNHHMIDRILAPTGGNVTSQTVQAIEAAAEQHQRIIICDVEFCRQEKLFWLCNEMCQKGFTIKLVFFENKPNECKRNAINRGHNLGEAAVIDRLSPIYNVPIIRPVKVY
jgi:predicted kinase